MGLSVAEVSMPVFMAGASGAIDEPLITELLKSGHSVVGMTFMGLKRGITPAGRQRLRWLGNRIPWWATESECLHLSIATMPRLERLPHDQRSRACTTCSMMILRLRRFGCRPLRRFWVLQSRRP